MAETCEVPIDKLSIKNKGSIVKLSEYYINLYNMFLEKYSLRCAETRYVHTEKSAEINAIEWDWFAYKELDDFARLKFKYSSNAYYVKGDKIMGIFGVSYTLELDYKKMWRNSRLLKPLLPFFLRLFYQSTIIQWLGRYVEEIEALDNDVRRLLNVSVFD